MFRYVLKLEYDGTDYAGWQRQKNALSVQECLERAWEMRSFGNLKTIGASRTDAGVHARGQIVLLEGEKDLAPDVLRAALNGILPEDIVIRRVIRPEEKQPAGKKPFHPRYSARGKYYTYRLAFGAVRPVLCRRGTAYVKGSLDVTALLDVLSVFEGERDFTALMDQGSPTKRSIRRLYRVDAVLTEDEISPLLTFHIVGDGFLYHMVRILVGTAVAAGKHKLDREMIVRRLDEKCRVGLGMTMPPQGLCLERVFYDKTLFGNDDKDALLRCAEAGGNNNL
jgi:tRNA pseudouridine38-40 synthase